MQGGGESAQGAGTGWRTRRCAGLSAATGCGKHSKTTPAGHLPSPLGKVSLPLPPAVPSLLQHLREACRWQGPNAGRITRETNLWLRTEVYFFKYYLLLFNSIIYY